MRNRSGWMMLVALVTLASPALAAESRVAELYVRTIGSGPVAIVLHGGPDFDHAYLLPELDRLADAYQLVYYDQRGRGRSASHVRTSPVTLATETDDLDRIRRHFGARAPVLIGHSWGTVLALEYALRHPNNVSRLILLNPAPASVGDFQVLRKSYLEQLGADMEAQRRILDSAAYRAGDPETVAARYRIHFKHALSKPADYETLMARMRAQFIAQGKDGILKARAAEDELMRDSWESSDYDLIPKLSSIRIPTLVLTGARDFIPVEIARRIANGIPNAQLVVVEDCGHFSYLECGDSVRAAIQTKSSARR